MRKILFIVTLALMGCESGNKVQSLSSDCVVISISDAGPQMDRVLVHDNIYGIDITFLSGKSEFKTGQAIEFKPDKYQPIK